MSTRCQILVEGADVLVYRHSDGYPDGPHGVLKALKPIVSNFIKWRGFDETYLPAHIVSEMIVAHKKWCDKQIRRTKKDATKDEKSKKSYIDSYESQKYLGYGVDAYTPDADNTGLHGDIEFLYVVKKNGTIEVRTCDWCFADGNKCGIENTKLKKTVRYSRKGARKLPW